MECWPYPLLAARRIETVMTRSVYPHEITRAHRAANASGSSDTQKDEA
jgi:hypothetical protein